MSRLLHPEMFLGESQMEWNAFHPLIKIVDKGTRDRHNPFPNTDGDTLKRRPLAQHRLTWWNSTSSVLILEKGVLG